MEKFKSIKSGGVDLISVRAYQGDAMTLLCFDLDASLLDSLAGFTIRYVNAAEDEFVYNRMTFPLDFRRRSEIPAAEKNSTLYAPIQRFSWIHVPRVPPGRTEAFFGRYTYQVTPRYVVDAKLAPLDPAKTVSVAIDVGPYRRKNTQIAFTRGFMSSAGYVSRFGLTNKKVRPVKAEDELLFDVGLKSGTAKRFNEATGRREDVEYTFEEQHRWLGWQARQRILEFLDETLADPALSLKAFAYDLDEPEIARRLLRLAAEGRLRIILDDAGEHGEPESFETAFETEFKKVADPAAIERGKYRALAHQKVFVQLKNAAAVKVLTGSTNFSTNGLYVNANHVLIFKNRKIARQYEEVFDASFGAAQMSAFRGGALSAADFEFAEPNTPRLTVTFAPHQKADAERIFERISSRIRAASSDVFFAIMKDTSESSILDAVREMVKSERVYTYGITDTISRNDADYEVFVYQPNSKRGVRVAAKGVASLLPPPFGEVPRISGYAIHHKFVVVDFRGSDPVVFCGSSNLAFGPEQKNGDNLLEIRDADVATVFAIEAGRLVDHFQWRNKELTEDRLELDDLGPESRQWFRKYYNPNDLRCLEREKFIAPRA
jgi:phosphatidylserine/phosphatidylglycerophosphate/cardiolipin synthase-like enzyme